MAKKKITVSKESASAGVVYLIFSQLSLILSNYGIHIGLAHFVGEATYGLFGVLMSLYLINRALLNTGLPRAVSKFVAEGRYRFEEVFYTSRKLQYALSFLFAGAYILFAKQIASLLKDPTLTPYIVYLGFIVIPLSLLALYSSGFLNGLRLFRKQAIVKIIYPLLRVLFTLIFVLLGFNLYGVLTGYLCGIVGGLFLAKLFLPLRKVEKPKKNVFTSSKVLSFSLYISAASLILTLLRNVNVLFIKSMLEDNIATALFTAASTIANVPLVVFGALPFVLLPSISKSIAKKNVAATKKYIQESLRYLLLLLLPIVVLITATAPEILTLLYPSTYIAAASTLSILAIASIFLAFLTTLSSILVGAGKAKEQLMFVGVGLIILVGANFFLVPLYGIIGAALSLLISSFIAVSLAYLYIYKKFGATISLLSTVRIFTACAGIFFIVWNWHNSGFQLILEYALLGGLYFLLLFFLKEIGITEWKLVKKVVKR